MVKSVGAARGSVNILVLVHQCCPVLSTSETVKQWRRDHWSSQPGTDWLNSDLLTLISGEHYQWLRLYWLTQYSSVSGKIILKNIWQKIFDENLMLARYLWSAVTHDTMLDSWWIFYIFSSYQLNIQVPGQLSRLLRNIYYNFIVHSLSSARDCCNNTSVTKEV